MARVGGRPPRIPGAIQSSRERVHAVGLDLSDRTARILADRESPRIRAGRHSRGVRSYSHGEVVAADFQPCILARLIVSFRTPATWALRTRSGWAARRIAASFSGTASKTKSRTAALGNISIESSARSRSDFVVSPASAQDRGGSADLSGRLNPVRRADAARSSRTAVNALAITSLLVPVPIAIACLVTSMA